MSFGPFATYVPPGVYSRTLTEANVASLIAGLRIPFIIGVGQEELEQDDLEMVRGSSSTLDQQIVNEDVTVRWIVDNTNPSNPTLGANDGSRVTFQVRNFPLVDGQGFGRVTNDSRSVSVTVNGSPVAVGNVLGSMGEVTLQVPPQPTDNVRVTYYFHRGDTAFTDDVSAQVSTVNPSITTPGFEPFVIAAGSNDTLKIAVNGGAEYTVTFLAGSVTASSLKTQVDAGAIPGLQTSVFSDNEGKNHLKFMAVSSVVIGTGTINGILGLSSGQTASGNTQFRVFQRPMVDGTSGGITTTDTSKVVVKVNNVQVIPTAVDGANGLVTLSLAPAPGSVVTINYWANTWQDTFDYLPNTLVTNVIRCGISSNRSDYIQNQDFVVVNPSPDVSIVHWGTSYSVASTLNTPGTEPFDSSQIVPTLVDDKLYLVECEPYVDTTVIPAAISNTVFVLPEVPTTGNGRDSVLGTTLFNSVANNRQDLITNRPDLIIARVGRTLEDALNRAAATVIAVDGPNRKITIKDAIPPDWTVFATFYYNRIVDDTYILTNKIAGPIGVGQYEVFSSLTNENLYQVRFGTKSALPQTVQFPRGVEQIPDAMHVGGHPVGETVTVTFDQSLARNAVYTNEGAQPYSFYTASASWSTLVNAATVTTALGTAARAYLVSQAVPLDSGNLATTLTTANNALNLTIDGVPIVNFEITRATDTITGTPTDWTGSYGAGFTHANTPNTTPLADTTVAAIVGVSYTLTITLTGGTVGTVTATFGGGTTGAIPFGTATTSVTFVATSTANLVITPSSTYDGTVEFSIKQDAIALPLGAVTPAAIATAVNNAIDGTVGFTGTAPNYLFTPIPGPGTDSTFFVIRSLTAPGALPGGFDAVSSVAIGQGTAEVILGFTTFQSAVGTPGALNKPATLLSSNSNPFTFTPGVNDALNLRLNGIDLSVVLTNELLGSTGWTTTSGWTGTYNSFAHTAGTTTLSNSLAAISGVEYSLTITITGRTAGTVTATFGGGTTGAISATTTTAITASTTAALVITPTNDFDGTVAISLASGDAIVIAPQIQSVISSQGSATEGTLGNVGKIRITSNTNSSQSTVLILAGTANSVLGFTESQFASQSLVSVQEVADCLMGTLGFAVSSWTGAPTPNGNGAVAYPTVLNNQTYLTIESVTTGSLSSIGFSTSTAFNSTTGTGIVAGTSGDNGEDSTDVFVVTSSNATSGSSGTGYPGQTYTDARTGLRFSILPSTTSYAIGGSFTLIISQAFLVNPGIPYYFIPGLETIVNNTVNVGTNDTANIQTFNPSGLEPKNGDYYYISYRYMKQDFSTKIFTTFKTIEANYGKLSAENRVTLGAYLAILNGAVLVGITQVTKVPNTNQASAQSFITAINGLATPLPGNVKPDILVPLSTDTAVYSALTQHCEVMSNIRNQSERMGMIGFASGTSPTTAQTVAKNLFSSRIVAYYPDSAVVTFTDELGSTYESLVDGTFFAAAVAGAVCSPAIDVATPYTHRQVQGFTRIPRIMDPVEANQTAVAGITVLEDLQPVIRIRQGLTTNMTSVLTRLPTVTQIADYVSISSRSVLDAFVGTKFLASRTNEVEVSMTSLFKQLIQQEIVAAFTGISATVDANDPTTLNAEAYYQPIFPLLYLVLTFNLRARI